MVARFFLLGMMAVGLLGFGMVAWISAHPPAVVEAQAAPAPKAMVLSVAHMLRAGSLLKPEDIEAREINKADMPAGATLDTQQNRTQLSGAMVRHSVGQGDILLAADIMRPGEHGFLAAVLGPGLRAVTVSVDAVSGTAGLIWPGDHVDLILLQTREDQALPAGRRTGARTLLSDVRVIAIDQRLVQGAAPDSGQIGRTATLEVNPEQAELVAVAAHIGTLSLTLRSADPGPGDKATLAEAGHAPMTWASDVSPSLNPSSNQEAASRTLKVFQGTGDGKEFKF